MANRTPPHHLTEREVAAGLAKNLSLEGTPFQELTVEHKVGNFYADLVLWEKASEIAFAFWELKKPYLQEDLSRLRLKAQSIYTALKARYVVTWNFQEAHLYEIKPMELHLLKTYPVPLLQNLEEWSLPSKKTAVLEVARLILDDLARLYHHESLPAYLPDKHYFIGILSTAIYQLAPLLEEHIRQRKKDPNHLRDLNAYTVQQGYPLALENLDGLLGRHWAYSLAVRLLFYFTIQRHFSKHLPPLEGSGNLHHEPQEAFSKAQQIDWQAIFEPSPLDRLGLPDSAEKPLRDLIAAMRRYDFSQLKEDVIGQIMEGLIPPEERHALGQYFTREDLVDFILGFVAKTEKAYYLDPTCGSGIFLVRLYHRLSWLSHTPKIDHASLLERLWGVDVAHFPAELATINLFRQNTRDYTNFPRILVSDFFELSPGQKVEFPPLRSTGLPYEKIQLPFPQFDGIVGNFPYIRQEIIERQKAGYKKELIRAIARYWLWKDPKLFRLKKTAQKELRTVPPAERDRWLEEALEQNQIELRLSGQADIYAYLFYHAAAFLKEKGRMGIVTSNAWLDVAYGLELKRFFLRHFKIIAIVASWAEPWFVDAAINTAFVILERCEDETEREKHQVAFVKMRKPLKDILPQDLLLQAHKRWEKVDALVRQIEGAPDEAYHLSCNTLEKPDMRIRLIPQKHLQDQLTQKKENAKWGLYIRAPQVYFDILEKAGPKLIPLHEVAEVRFGIKTGINDFFISRHWVLVRRRGRLRSKMPETGRGRSRRPAFGPSLKAPKKPRASVLTLLI